MYTAILLSLIVSLSGAADTTELYTPQYPDTAGSGMIGTAAPLLDLANHLIAVSQELLKVFASLMELLGLEDQEFVKNFFDAMETGQSLVNRTQG